MDHEKFGNFIVTLRKEQGLTQAELAQRLHVTDKAVSKWERGLGFPDIKLIEPLADALGVTILEIMQAEKISEREIPQQKVSQTLTDTFSIAQKQRQKERRQMFCVAGIVTLFILLIFLLDAMGSIGFFMVCLPFITLALGVLFLVIGITRKRQHLSYRTTLFTGCGLLLYPLVFFLFLLLAMPLGIGPIPN